MSRVDVEKYGKHWRTLGYTGIVVGSSLLLSNCDRVDGIETITPPPDGTHEHFSTETPVPTATATVTPEPSPTFTPTPDYARINREMMETALVGEELQLENVVINRVIVVNWRIGEGIYGVISNPDGSTRAVVQNFDCQFKDLRDLNLLGEPDDPMFNPLFPIRSWESKVLFPQLNVVKDTDIADGIGLYSSKSYEIDGNSKVCEKDPLARPYIEGAETFAQRARDFLLRVIEDIRDK